MVDGVELPLRDEPQQVPSAFSAGAKPAAKSLMSGTCANTLLPMSRSAASPSSASCRASRSPKNSTRVVTPRARAASATLAAGSMPSTGMPAAWKYCSR